MVNSWRTIPRGSVSGAGPLAGGSMNRGAHSFDSRWTARTLGAVWTEWTLASVAGALLGGAPGLAFCYGITVPLFRLLLALRIGPLWASWGTIICDLCAFCCALGCGLGLVQGLILRPLSVGVGRWIGTTLFGFLLALAPTLAFLALRMTAIAGPTRLALDILLAVLSSGLFGFGQQLGLPPTIRKPRAWIVASVLSWLILPFALPVVARLLPDTSIPSAWQFITLSEAIFAVIGMITAGATIGGATGVSLLLVVTDHRRVSISSLGNSARDQEGTS